MLRICSKASLKFLWPITKLPTFITVQFKALRIDCTVGVPCLLVFSPPPILLASFPTHPVSESK